MTVGLTRRRLIAFGALAAPALATGGVAQERRGGWSLPIRYPGKIAGDGFMITRCYACENVDKYPGWWHTAEDWRLADDGETAGSEVPAVTHGEVVYAAFYYPGRVVIIAHDDGLFSVYGHLDPDLDIEEGEHVRAGQVIGRVFRWTDGRAPSHLHFEIRDFFFNPIVNGDSPSYGVVCGYRCPPGPGYWPMSDGRLPVDLGWRNPTHVIGNGLARMLPDEVQVAATAGGLVLPVRDAPVPNASIAQVTTLVAGECFGVLDVASGAPNTQATSALGYDLQFLMTLPSGLTGWIDAVAADSRNVGSDGRPAAIRPVLLPLTAA